MLKGVGAVRGSGPELMAGGAVAVLPPAVRGSAAAWTPARGSRSGPPASDPPSTLGPSPVCPSSCTPTPSPRAAVGLELVGVPAAVFLQAVGTRGEARGTTRPTRLRGAAPRSLWLDPSRAAPRCCVPQTPRLAAAPAHKLVGNKIAFPGRSGRGFVKFQGDQS